LKIGFYSPFFYYGLLLKLTCSVSFNMAFVQ
jgi:hypothetical protein